MDDLTRDQNRAHIVKGGAIEKPLTRGFGEGIPGQELPPSIRGDAPMTLDPHSRGRGHFDNMVNKPGEKSRAAESTETRRRLGEPSSTKYR